MITKQQKQVKINILAEEFKKASGVYIVDFKSMSVAETNKVRNLLRAKELRMVVAKNTLIDRAIDESGFTKIPWDLLKGQSGVIFTYDDPTVPAKIIAEVSEKTEKPRLKAAVLDGQLYDGTQLKTIAALPSKKDLYSAIVGSLSAPASGIVGVISAVLRDVAYLIEEVAKKQNDAA